MNNFHHDYDAEPIDSAWINEAVDPSPTHELKPIVNSYKRAEEIVWARMDDWQKAAISDSRKTKTNDDDPTSIARRFAREIEILVDCDLNTKADRYINFVKTQKSRG